MNRPKLVSLYEGFFSGGARILHTDVMVGLQERGFEQSVVSINNQVNRENTHQPMELDRSYRRLARAGIAIASLGRAASGEVDYSPFSKDELAIGARELAGADLVFSVKEQPMRLVNQLEAVDVPVVVGLHRSDPEHQGQSLDDLRLAVKMGRVAAMIATAESSKRAYGAAGIPSDLIHVIRNGIDLERFRPSSERRESLRKELGIADDMPVVAFAARFDPMKDVPLFLASAKSYLTKETHAAILMCGAGMTVDNPRMRQAIEEEFAGALGLTSRLWLLGIRHDMETVYAAADIVSSTSRFGETYPLCLIEGLACGAVPVATEVGDTPEIVGDGRGSLTPRDPAVIAEAWQHAYEARPQFTVAIAASRQQFSREKMIDAYADIARRFMRKEELAGLDSLPAV